MTRRFSPLRAVRALTARFLSPHAATEEQDGQAAYLPVAPPEAARDLAPVPEPADDDEAPEPNVLHPVPSAAADSALLEPDAAQRVAGQMPDAAGEEPVRVEETPAPAPRARWARAADRDAIVRCFEDALDEILAREEPPDGVEAEILARFQHGPPDGAEPAPDDGTDLYSLWSALVALTQETKLQGRAFRDLGETLGSVGELTESVRAMLEAHAETRADGNRAIDAARQIADEAGRQRYQHQRQELQRARDDGRQGMLGLLLDVRDRLVRGLASAREHVAEASEDAPATVFMRLLRIRPPDNSRLVDAGGALIKGYTLGLARLDEALGRFGVGEIDCSGRPFDPECMMAVDVEETSAVADGTVLEVYRAGYERHGKVCRPAEVKVARGITTGRAGTHGQSTGETEAAKDER